MVTYKSRKNTLYYLQEGRTSKGNPRYYFSRYATDPVLDEVPSGYEIYETPYAQVFLTKIKSRRITDLEKFYLQKAVPRISKLRYFLLDTKKDSITLYRPHQDVSYLDELVERGVKDISNFVTYGCDLRFLLVDSSKRLFQLQLHIHRPAVDNWWGIGQPARLSTLMEKYGPHFDDDSFYDMDHPVID